MHFLDGISGILLAVVALRRYFYGVVYHTKSLGLRAEGVVACGTIAPP